MSVRVSVPQARLGQCPQRKCRTPRRERPCAASQETAVPIEFVLQDESQFPQLPEQLDLKTPRGRKARRSHTAWDAYGKPIPSRSQSLSRDAREQQSQVDVENPEHSRRARAYSHDAGMEAFAAKDEPRTPRPSLKKSHESVAPNVDAAGSAELADLEKTMQETLLRMAALKGLNTQAQVGMQLNQILAALPGDLETKVLPKSTEAMQPEKIAEEPEVSRPRRLSNPQQMNTFELPTGSSWEYPLSKTEKQARVVMISSVEIDYLEEENAALQEENAALRTRDD